MKTFEQLTKSLTDYTFTVDGRSFVIRAECPANAFGCANAKVREDGMVSIDDAFAWFHSTKENHFYLNHNVHLD